MSKEFESFPLTPSEGLSGWRVLQSACVEKRGALLASCFPYIHGASGALRDSRNASVDLCVPVIDFRGISS